MCGEHKHEAAALLGRADELYPHRPVRYAAEVCAGRQTILTEALVHAVLHLAEEVATNCTVAREQ